MIRLIYFVLVLCILTWWADSAFADDATGAKDALIADAKQGLVALMCPQSSEGTLRVTAVAYMADSRTALVGSRTYVLDFKQGRPSSVRYFIDAGQNGADVELFRGSFSSGGERVSEIWLGGKQAEVNRVHENIMRKMIATALAVADEFCVGSSGNSRDD